MTSVLNIAAKEKMFWLPVEVGRGVRQATTLPRGRVTAGSTLGPGALDQQESALSLDQRGFPEGSELEQRPDG